MSNNKSLTTLVEDSLTIDRMIFESDGEITPELEALMETLGNSLKEKADSIGFVLKNLELREMQMKERAREYSDMAKRFSKSRTRLKSYLVSNIEQLNVDSVSGDDYKLSLRENPGRVEITESELESKYLMEERRMVPDKDRIKTDLVKGIEIKGAKLIKEKTIMLRMKGPK